MNKNDLKKLIGECIKEMSNDGDEFKVFDTDVDRSMARQKDLAFGTGEIKFKSNTGTDYTVGIDNGDIINVVDKRGNTYDVDEIQTYWEKGFTLIRAISATIGDNDSSQPAQPDEEEKGMLHPPDQLQETDKEISKKSKDIPKDVKCKECGKPVKLGTSSTLCPSCHEKSLDAAEKYYGVQEGDEEGEKSKDTPKDVLDPNVKQVFWKDFKQSTVRHFVDKYGKEMADPKFHAFVTAGISDKIDDESFQVASVTLAAKALEPTQNQIGFNNSLDDLIKPMFNESAQIEELKKILGGTNVILRNKKGEAPIVIFAGKYIIDGHHRWSKTICGNKDATVACLNFTCANLKSVETILKAFHLAIAAELKKIVVDKSKGANLFDSNKETVITHVSKNITQKFSDEYKRTKQLKDTKAIAEYIAGNASFFFGKSGAADGGTLPRHYMPQTDTSGTYQDALTSGKLNFLPDTVTEKMVNETFKKHLGLLYKKLKLK